MKQEVRDAKGTADFRWGQDLSRNFKQMRCFGKKCREEGEGIQGMKRL